MAINDIATLGIEVNPRGAISGANRARRAILGIGNAANGIKSAIFSLQGAIAAIGVGALVKSAVQTSASLETLKIRLKTVTGSTEDAAIAFNMLTDFTTRTPYEIEEVASAFTKLKAYGLAPTEKSLTSFGNTASAMGKSLDQMIEAVADAATGEFERLKEFGIKAKTEGDRVKFTFQGVTTEVGKNSAEIKAYLEEIGNTKFAGAMKIR
jgi:phage tail tape-measure protein